MENVTVTVEEVNPTSRKLKISVEAAEVERALSEATETVRRKAAIKGFRKGKAPLDVVKRIYGGEIESEALQQLLSESYVSALGQCDDLRVISRPTIQDINFTVGKPFQYEATVEVMPEVSVKKYKGLAVEVFDDVITEQQIKSHIEGIREQHARLEPMLEIRPAADGDFAIVDSQASIDGEPFAGGNVDGFTVELGKGTTLTGFDENLLGMKPGDVREFDLTLSEERFANSPYAGKTAHFKVTLKDLKKKVLPELNDEFAKDLGEFSSIREFEDHMGKQLRDASKERFQREAQSKLIEALVEANRFDVPAALVGQEVENMLAEARHNLAGHGRRFSDEDPFMNQLRERFQDEAKKRVQAGFLLDAVAKKESFSVNEFEVEQYLQKLSEQVGKPLDDVKRYYSDEKALDSLKLKMVEEKTLEFLMENAKISKKMVPLDDSGPAANRPKEATR